MELKIDRRRLILGAGLGVGALLLPAGRLLAGTLNAATGFTHNVASGEPAADAMLFWTRYVPATGNDDVVVRLEVAADPLFARVVGGAEVRTGAWRDWTVKATVTGLRPATVYWYRFVSPQGELSPAGRTKTLPVGAVERFGLALFSCSNLPVGWFNAYAHAAARNDLDLWLHVGDYIYEYGIDAYAAHTRIQERALLPAHDHEMISLSDYRMRFACYRADPDLQKLHQYAPMVALWDDHEITNDTWQGGAQNHQPGEGDWHARKAAAIQAYREWLPVSDEPWKAYPIGDLATLYRTESRAIGRTRPADIGSAYRIGTRAALEAFRDGPWRDASATMLGLEQEAWLASQFAAKARRSTWQLVGMATPMGQTLMPRPVLDWLKPELSQGRRRGFDNAVRGGEIGLPMWMDRWDGYPAARSRLLQSALAADANLVMLSGDSHNGWAFSLQEQGQAAGVELSCPAVTSGGMEGSMAMEPKRVAQAFIDRNHELDWCDTSQRGYVMLDIAPDQLEGTWVFMQDIKQRTTALSGTHRMTVARGKRRFNAA